jgi:4-diphosphocytidyl-2-C-methyl-D-erythritol kinase
VSTVRVHAPAKVNPTLEVLGRRADGLHEVRTTLLALELGDTLELALAPAGGAPVRARVVGPHASADVPADERNLAVRALAWGLARARAVAPERAPPALALTLTKNVPAQAGLGGGSSDAAAALHALEALCEIDLGARDRAHCLAQLGADCVFFDAARATGLALCTGSGTDVEVLPGAPRDWTLALVAPRVACPTGAVYGALGFPLSPPPAASTVPDLFQRSATRARAGLHNDLEEAALRAVPELRAWRSALDRAGATAFRLSGSGSSFFGLFDDAASARAAVRAIEAQALAAGLALRGAWVTRPAGRTSQLV